MKKILVLITAAFLVNSAFADVASAPISIESPFEIVDVAKIYEIKTQSEADSNLVFSISRFTYTGISEIEFNEIIADIKNNFVPTSENRIITFVEIHNVYDETQSHPYTGKTYLAIEKRGETIEFIVFWADPNVKSN